MSGYHAMATHYIYHFCINCCDVKRSSREYGKQIIKNDDCLICHGTGKPCELCHGTGKVKEEIKCPACNQVCKVIEKPCPNLKKR